MKKNIAFLLLLLFLLSLEYIGKVDARDLEINARLYATIH